MSSVLDESINCLLQSDFVQVLIICVLCVFAAQGVLRQALFTTLMSDPDSSSEWDIVVTSDIFGKWERVVRSLITIKVRLGGLFGQLLLKEIPNVDGLDDKIGAQVLRA